MSKPLQQRSVHELRAIAQALGVTDIFEKDTLKLIQEIEIKRNAIVTPNTLKLPTLPDYDARLMTKPPSRISSAEELVELLNPYITMGLKLRLEEERWYMIYGQRTDEGTMRMPLRHVLECANRIMRGKN